MWMSMTGFGRGEAHEEDVSVTVDVRSVNHRFLDVHVRCPSKFLSWETRVRGLVRESLRRGKVDVFLNVREWGRTGTVVRVNRSVLSSFLDEASRIRDEIGFPIELTFRDLMGVPDLFAFTPEGADPAEERWGLAEKAVRDALSMLRSSRMEEGERLRTTIGESVRGLASYREKVASLSFENKELAISKFKEKIKSLSGEAGLDPARLHQEAAFLLDRQDITEECDRLGSHLAGLSNLLGKPGEAVGKRFDFLVQEVFRELNTASAKSAHAEISEVVVNAKTELEKIREQIQNVE
jgi:uncharacterized protein (TIGR00255 family)